MRQRVLAIAKCEQGVKENPPGSNSQKYGIWYGVDKQPWCAMFVCWVFWLAGRAIPKIQNEYGSAFVPFIYDHFKKANKLTENPQAADMVIYDWNGDKKGDHIGIFDKWNEKEKSFWAWEGNTSPTSDSNGGEVMYRLRYVSNVLGFIDHIGK